MDSSIEESSMCSTSEVKCSSGTITIIACSSGSALLENSAFKKSKFKNLALGSLSASFEEDWSRGYFAYIDPVAGAIYFEGELDAFDDPLCAGEVAPIVNQYLERAGFREETRRVLREIVFRRIFRLAGFQGF